MTKKGKKKKQQAAAAAASSSKDDKSKQQQVDSDEEETPSQPLPSTSQSQQQATRDPRKQPSQQQQQIAQVPQPSTSQSKQQATRDPRKQQTQQQQQKSELRQEPSQQQAAPWSSPMQQPQQKLQGQWKIPLKSKQPSQQQQQGAQGLQQPIPQQLPQEQQPLQQQQQGPWVGQQPPIPQQPLQQQQQGAWGAPRQLYPQQPPQQQQQGAWGAPRQQFPQQPPQQQQQGAWGVPRQQFPQQPPQQQQPQGAWGAPRQQFPQQPPQQQQQQGAWGAPRQPFPQQPPQQQQQQRAPQQQFPQQPPPPGAWVGQQPPIPQQLPQQQQQGAWGPRQPIPQQSAQEQQQRMILTQQQQEVQQRQKQQKISVDIGAAGDQQQPSTSKSATRTSKSSIEVSELGMTDPFYSETVEKAKMTSAQLKSYQDMIPKRAHPDKGGTIGEKISVITNMFKIIFNDNFVTNAIHYDVTIKPYKRNGQPQTGKEKTEVKLPRVLCRDIFEKCRSKNFKNRFPAYDGKKNAYSANNLPFDDYMTDVFEHVGLNERRNQYEIIINKVAHVDLSWLKNLKPGSKTHRDQTAVQVLDIILRHAPESQFTNIGRSLFWDINEREPLGGGLALARGGFMSGILGWKPYLNVDVSHKGFTMRQRVLTYISDTLRINERDLTYENIMNSYNTLKIRSFLRGLKVSYEIPNKLPKRTHRIKDLSNKTANHKFMLETGDTKREITIKQYFLEVRGYNIQRPDLPTLLVNIKGTTEILLPIELCTIMPKQAIGKLDEEQTSNMIRKAATDAMTRKHRIEDAFRTIRVNNSPVMEREFHLSVNKEMETVSARILPVPSLKYGTGRMVVPNRGTWNLQPFHDSKTLERYTWTIVNVCGVPNIDPAIQEFVKLIQTTAREVGMIIDQPFTPFKSYRPNDERAITKYFNDNKSLKLIIVIIPNRTDLTYGKVKKITEMEIGNVLTQCIKLQTLKKLEQYKQAATVKNILLKINSKLNGTNHIFGKSPSCLDRCPCMLVGADVTHPSPDSKDIPSIAAVAASRDLLAFRYNITLRLQQPKEEMILDLEQIIVSQLNIYRQETKCLPKRIIYYRDGVSEGQLPQVMFYEIRAIKKAITRFPEGGNIEVTCLVVQKRHHVRFFPISKNDTADRNFNVKVGTIVDTTITHPDHIDFYLVSHASIQGTARPTKYRCIYNQSNFTEDQLEELTFYLCHIYARCARSVSYPAPTYYAHLAAYRGRALIKEDRFTLSELENAQRNFILKMGASPMFFV